MELNFISSRSSSSSSCVASGACCAHVMRLLPCSSASTTTCSSSSLASSSPSASSPSSSVDVLSFAHRTRSCLPLRLHAHANIRCRSLSACRPLRCAVMENAVPAKQEAYIVGDFMTKKEELLVVKPYTSVDEALELLVDNRITGLPVVDDAGKLIGVVSDYDLLALDSVSGKRSSNTGLFPEPDSTWKAFKQLQRLLSKTKGKTVGEVMTPSPLVVREMTNLEDAARLLLVTKYRRLPVVDESGVLIGLLTRGNVVGAALSIKRTAEKITDAR